MPLSKWMRGAQPLGKYTVEGSLTTLTAPQMTDVAPNRCGEPVNRPKETHVLRGGEEVSLNHLEINAYAEMNIYQSAVNGALKKGANAEVEG